MKTDVTSRSIHAWIYTNRTAVTKPNIFSFYLLLSSNLLFFTSTHTQQKKSELKRREEEQRFTQSRLVFFVVLFSLLLYFHSSIHPAKCSCLACFYFPPDKLKFQQNFFKEIADKFFVLFPNFDFLFRKFNLKMEVSQFEASSFWFFFTKSKKYVRFSGNLVTRFSIVRFNFK